MREFGRFLIDSPLPFIVRPPGHGAIIDPRWEGPCSMVR